MNVFKLATGIISIILKGRVTGEKIHKLDGFN